MNPNPMYPVVCDHILTNEKKREILRTIHLLKLTKFILLALVLIGFVFLIIGYIKKDTQMIIIGLSCFGGTIMGYFIKSEQDPLFEETLIYLNINQHDKYSFELDFKTYEENEEN